MITKDDFVTSILAGVPAPAATKAPSVASALPLGIGGFPDDDEEAPAITLVGSLGLRLLEASGLKSPATVQRSSLVRNADQISKDLPLEATYWDDSKRPYKTLLFESKLTSSELWANKTYGSDHVRHLDLVEDALARLVDAALLGFEKGGEGVTSKSLKGVKTKTLCVISIVDVRDEKCQGELVCFGTYNAHTSSLETFFISEQVRAWEPQLAREHLGLLYERQFKKLEGNDWQEAFTTSHERAKAEELLDICSKKSPKKSEIEDGVLDLLDTIAASFGLHKIKGGRRLQTVPLPPDHDIGIDPAIREKKYQGTNPFEGVTLRDHRSRLLGYIVYPLKSRGDAELLGGYLKKNNRFHNVLVVFPDQADATIELWQGNERLRGILKKGSAQKGAADVVSLLSRFFVVSKAKVKNPKELAIELAYRAKYLRKLALQQYNEETAAGPLRTLYAEFTKALVKDMKVEEFADAFAQTLAYSLLSARWVMSSQENNADRFTRRTALQRMSIGSRFLSEMFAAVLEMESKKERLLWLVDDIADLLDRVDIVKVFKPDPAKDIPDPIVHFYEPFLKEYDPLAKMQRGAFYTPQAVVSHIVRSVHDLLKSEFNLVDGLADVATWGEMITRRPELRLPPLTDLDGERRTISPDQPFVQILDPATGTGTFLVEAIDLIYKTLQAKWIAEGLSKEHQKDEWNKYVPKHLLPRLTAFELTMAPYAIAHMKVGLKLAETGYHFAAEHRAQIYLTNALEPWPRQAELPSISALAHESRMVAEIKQYRRFSVVVGNPPYSGHSANSGLFDDQVDRYKQVGGKSLKLGQAKWLHNDYIKFVCLAESALRLSGCGVLGFITDHSFLDNGSFIGFRASLLTTFSHLRVLNLHGNAKLNRNSVDGDSPVFEITQGVCVFVGVAPCFSNSTSHQTSSAFLGDLRGAQETKFTWLRKHTMQESTTEVPVSGPHFSLLMPHQNPGLSTASLGEYASWPSICDFYLGNQGTGKVRRVGTGFVSTHDEFAISWTKATALEKVDTLLAAKTEEAAREEFRLCGTTQWNFKKAVAALRQSKDWRDMAIPILYRPFDKRWTVWDPNVCVHRRLAANEPLRRGELALCVGQAGNVVADPEWNLALASASPVDFNLFYRGGEAVFPTRLMSEQSLLSSRDSWQSNFNPQLTKLLPVPARDNPAAFIYSILYSRKYRQSFAAELSRDYPRIPLFCSVPLARSLVKLGERLIALHALEADPHGTPVIGVPPVGTVVEPGKPTYEPTSAKVMVTKTEGFSGIPPRVWEFRVGGYQVCHKWLKDRKGTRLNKSDLIAYQKTVGVLAETIHVMEQIDSEITKDGDWPGAFAKAGNPK